MKKTNIMTVGRLKAILAKYDDNEYATVWGGESEYGSFGVLGISETKEDADFGICHDYIMEYDD